MFISTLLIILLVILFATLSAAPLLISSEDVSEIVCQPE
jgi:hypothetical protein